MRALMTAAALVLLAGCAIAPPARTITVEKPVEVAVPVVAKCDVKIQPEAIYPDSDAAVAGADNLTDLAKMYRGGRALRDARIAYLTAILAQCVG